VRRDQRPGRLLPKRSSRALIAHPGLGNHDRAGQVTAHIDQPIPEPARQPLPPTLPVVLSPSRRRPGAPQPGLCRSLWRRNSPTRCSARRLAANSFMVSPPTRVHRHCDIIMTSRQGRCAVMAVSGAVLGPARSALCAVPPVGLAQLSIPDAECCCVSDETRRRQPLCGEAR
jgi:hypothetical protein